ncbi:hypothetical protein ABZZ16_31125 [Streptomyces sp. NPDC006386]|uniref:hypothetical protein n=1 Tax=Streptomyces sp. NPDC006386 TaxID=3156762 RepID=UPI0033A0565D
MAAIGGLVFSAITTLYGAKVAQDQLAQSRDDSDQKKREQASRISYWKDMDNSRLHVMNRSPDPIQDVVVEFRVGVLPRTAPVPPEATRVQFLVALGSLPPCSEVLFERKNFRWTAKHDDSELASAPHAPLTADDRDAPGFRKMTNDGLLSFSMVKFIDRDGAEWVRRSGGELESEPGTRAQTATSVPSHAAWTSPEEDLSMRGELLDYPPVKPLETCKDG